MHLDIGRPPRLIREHGEPLGGGYLGRGLLRLLLLLLAGIDFSDGNGA